MKTCVNHLHSKFTAVWVDGDCPACAMAREKRMPWNVKRALMSAAQIVHLLSEPMRGPDEVVVVSPDSVTTEPGDNT